MLMENADQSKAGAKIIGFIEESERFLEDFKPSRDSEFSEYDDADLTQLRMLRQQQIQPLKPEQMSKLQVY